MLEYLRLLVVRIFTIFENKRFHEKRLIALEFTTEEDLLYCLQLIQKHRPAMPISLPGRKSVIVPEEEVEFLEKKIKEKRQRFFKVAVVNAGEIPAERIATLREKYFGDRKTALPNSSDQTWKQKRIQELKKKLL